MKIHQVLKQKNRLAGEVASLEAIARRENSRRSDNPSTIECGKIFAELTKTRKLLVEIKGAIAKASAPIAEKLALLAEGKAEKTFLESLPTREGVELVTVSHGLPPERLEWKAERNRALVDALRAAAQVRINELQDEIDLFNAVTDI